MCWHAGVVPSVPPVTTGACSSALDCGHPSHYTCTAQKSVCVCNEATGEDSCVIHGTCQATACGTCSSCVASMLNFTQSVMASTNSSSIAITWTEYCTRVLMRNASQCDLVASDIKASTGGYAAKRAGALCAAVNDCNQVCWAVTVFHCYM